MNKELFDKVDGKYGSISTFIKALAERNDLDVAGYKAELTKLVKEFDSFGDAYTEFMFGYLQEIEQFKKDKEKWNAEKLEDEEIIRRLEERVKDLEKMVPKADYDYCALCCEKEYNDYWGLLDEETKSVLVTAHYLEKIILSENIDYSIVIIELSKSLENELKSKMYYPFLSNLPHIYQNDKSTFAGFVNAYLSNPNYNMSLGILVSSLIKPKFLGQTYISDFHIFLGKSGWKMKILYKAYFGEKGYQYSRKYRNIAAHQIITEKVQSSTCESETKELLDILFSSYTPQ